MSATVKKLFRDVWWVIKPLGRPLSGQFGGAESLRVVRHPRRVASFLKTKMREGLRQLKRPMARNHAQWKFSAADAFATIYSEYWRQADGLKDLHYGELAIRPVKAAPCDVKLLAYYLPQFHPIPENDSWWGRGFTEWRNVSKAVPSFLGHYQPRLPGELGYYDLRVPEVMRRQVELARLYGISAFCFHFYWFGGRRLLEAPVLAFLQNPDLDIQFCLCWANENWTRRWDGDEKQVLIGQSHSSDDDRALIRYLKKYFDDHRYLKIDGKPVLTVYRPSYLPDARKTVERWRAEAASMGLPGLYLVATNSSGFLNAQSMGFDALSEFPPHGIRAGRYEVNRLTDKYKGTVYRYPDVVDGGQEEGNDGGTRWPGVMPAWDNTARRPRLGNIFHGSTPALFRKWLDKSIARARRNPPDERFVVINAWNEWAEGAYLEPDRRLGYAYLAACGSAITDHSMTDERVAALFAGTREDFHAQRSLACILHLFYEDMAEAFARAIEAFGDLDLYITVPKDIAFEDARRIAKLFPAAYILEVENRGRDMLPFLTVFDAVRKGNHRFVCKLHTKNSAHLADGEVWREELIGSLLSPAAREAVRQAESAPKIGILSSKRTFASLEDKQVRRNSASRMQSLAARIGIKLTFNEVFIAGSMFWFRPEALALFSGIASAQDFECELGQLDGTLAHALERMTVICARASGYQISEIATSRPVLPRQYGPKPAYNASQSRHLADLGPDGTTTKTTPFVVVGMPRSGSTLLLTGLTQHPEIQGYGELLHWVRTERELVHTILQEEGPIFFDECKDDAISFLRSHVFRLHEGKKAAGFKLFAKKVECRGTARLFERLRDEVSNLHVLHITRRNYLDAFISLQVAKQTRSWVQWVGSPPSATTPQPIRLDPQEALTYCREVADADRYFEGLFAGDRYMQIRYEDLCTAFGRVLSEAYRFLEVCPYEASPQTEKQIAQNSLSLATNRDELFDAFGGSEFECFIRETLSD